MRYQSAPLDTALLLLFTAPALARLSSHVDPGPAPAMFSRWDPSPPDSVLTGLSSGCRRLAAATDER